MKLLVTTSQSLLHVDTDSGSVIPLDRGRGLYYGIAHAGDKLYVASRKRPAASTNEERSTERGQILIFDRSLKACGVMRSPFPLRDLHEIAWHDGKLYATCSHDNMVAIFDGSNWEQWFPLGGSMHEGEGSGDVNHFNSFFFEGDSIWVLAHNRGASELLKFSLNSKELQERIWMGDSAHNIWREDGQLYTCSSMEGRVIGDQGFSLHTGEFPRGIAFAENFRCVGISATAERKMRDFTTGRLAIYDGQWNAVKEIVMANEGLVLDIQIVPEGFAHDTGRDLPESSVPNDGFYRAYEDRNRGSRELIRSRLLAYRPFFEPWLERKLAPKALDLGCGRGEWLELLRDTGFAASGVDLDVGMLAGLRQRGLDVRHMDALQALRETPDDSIAIVSSFHVVEHVPFDYVRNMVREAMRVLKPGGLLILETPNPENLVVGSSLFYQDPTHLHPLPPELLRFTVEFEGFKRHIVARLQESPALRSGNDINLLSVLEGVSPDYAVVGQKSADAAFLQAFDPAFNAGYGITLPALAHRFEAQERRHTGEMLAAVVKQSEQKFIHILDRLTEADERIRRLEERLDQVFRSPTWRITAPIRWIDTQIRLARQLGLRTRLEMARSKLGARVQPKTTPAQSASPNPGSRGGFRQLCINTSKKIGLYGILKSILVRLSGGTRSHAAPLDPLESEMNSRSAAIYRDIKASAAREKREKDVS